MFYKQQNITKIDLLSTRIFAYLLYLETPYKPDKYQIGILLAKKKKKPQLFSVNKIKGITF